MKRILLATVALAAFGASARAQSLETTANWYKGYVPSVAEWQALFAGKGDLSATQAATTAASNAMIAAAAAQTLAAGAIPGSTLGRGGGPAVLDQAGTIGSNTVTALNGTVARTLATRFADTVNGADFGMKCDGTTDNTASLLAALAMSAGAPVEVDVPAGVCAVSSQIATVLQNAVRLHGRGMNVSEIKFTGTGATGGGFMIGLNNAANFTVDGVQIATTDPNSEYDGIEVYGVWSANQLAHNNAGMFTFVRNEVDGQFLHSVHALDLNFPLIADNRLTGPSSLPQVATLPSPNNLTTTPAAYQPDTASAVILLEGNTRPASVGGSSVGQQDYTLDASVYGNAIINGTAGIDLNGTQGGYFTVNKIFNGLYGIRSEAPGKGTENITVTGNYIYEGLDDIYLDGLDGSVITGNFMWMGQVGSSTPVGGIAAVFIRDGDSSTTNGNVIQWPFHGSGTAPGYALFFANDAASGNPHVANANAIYSIAGPILYGNDANTTGVSASGNDVVESSQPASGTSLSDATITASAPFGLNAYFGNSSPYPDLKTDGMGDLYLRRSFQCGGPFDTCTLKQIVGGSTVFSSDASGNVVAAGSVTTPRASTPLLNVTGSTVGHAIQQIVENFFAASGTPTTNGAAGGTTSNLGPLQTGLVRAYGQVTCGGNGSVAAWNVDGLWGGSTFGPVSGYFAANAAYGTIPSGWAVTASSLAGPSGSPATSGYVALAVTSGQSSYNIDCTATLSIVPNQ